MSELPELPDFPQADAPESEAVPPKRLISEEAAASVRTTALLSTAGLTLALSVGVGVGLGLLLDGWLKTNFMVIVFALVGTVAGFRQLILAVNRVNEEQDRQAADEKRRRRGG